MKFVVENTDTRLAISHPLGGRYLSFNLSKNYFDVPLTQSQFEYFKQEVEKTYGNIKVSMVTAPVKAEKKVASAPIIPAPAPATESRPAPERLPAPVMVKPVVAEEPVVVDLVVTEPVAVEPVIEDSETDASLSPEDAEPSETSVDMADALPVYQPTEKPSRKSNKPSSRRNKK